MPMYMSGSVPRPTRQFTRSGTRGCCSGASSRGPGAARLTRSQSPSGAAAVAPSITSAKSSRATSKPAPQRHDVELAVAGGMRSLPMPPRRRPPPGRRARSRPHARARRGGRSRRRRRTRRGRCSRGSRRCPRRPAGVVAGAAEQEVVLALAVGAVVAVARCAARRGRRRRAACRRPARPTDGRARSGRPAPRRRRSSVSLPEPPRRRSGPWRPCSASLPP